MYTIYTQNSCGYCHMAKNLLNEQKIDFIEVSLDHDQDARRIPQIFNGELHIGGYTELKQYLDSN